MKLVGKIGNPYSMHQVIVSLSLLCSCGTEIGNGRKPPLVPETSEPVYTEPNSPVATSSADTPNSAAPGAERAPVDSSTSNVSLAETLKYSLVACGSPIVDMQAAAFVDQLSMSELTVQTETVGTWTLSLNSLSPNDKVTVSKKANSAEPNGITSTVTVLGTQTCSAIVTTPSGSSGAIQKQITYADQYQTKWILDSKARLTSFSVQDSKGTVLQSWVLQE